MRQILDIYNPVWVHDNEAYFSITDYNFRKLGDMLGSIIVRVWNGDKLAGWNIVYSKRWKKECKLRKRQVKLRPGEPLTFYYGTMPFEKMGLEEYNSREFIRSIY